MYYVLSEKQLGWAGDRVGLGTIHYLCLQRGDLTEDRGGVGVGEMSRLESSLPVTNMTCIW